MLTADLRALVRETVTHARLRHSDTDHTVAGGVLTRSGRIILGLNTHHFTGGPCGEISALSNHASTHPDDPIVATAAAYGPTGSVIAPCGKCRQVFFDLDPAIRSVVRTPMGLEARPVAELLPDAFDWRTLKEPQRLYMWEGFENVIRSGVKQLTIRADDPFDVGPAALVFEKDSGEVVTIDARITEVLNTRFGALTVAHARADGFDDVAELQAGLREFYPGLSDDDPVDVISFAVADGTERS